MPLLVVTGDGRALRHLAPQSLSMLGLPEAEWVHAWLADSLQLFFGASNYLPIGREVNVTGSGPEGFLDFLAIDVLTGNTVIIEAKRDDFDSRRLIGQSVEYAAGVAGFSAGRLAEVYRRFTGDPDASLDDELSGHALDPDLVNRRQSIILVVQDSPRNGGSMLRLKSGCAYLRQTGLDINILQLRWYARDPSCERPVEDDIIEASFVWDVDTGSSQTKIRPTEPAFLLDKTDSAIEIYRSLIDLLDSAQLKYTRRTTSKHITFYGKSRAFLVVQFEGERIRVRLRLGDGVSVSPARELSPTHDKLSESDGFLHEIVISSPAEVGGAWTAMEKSYRHNSP